MLLLELSIFDGDLGLGSRVLHDVANPTNPHTGGANSHIGGMPYFEFDKLYPDVRQ